VGMEASSMVEEATPPPPPSCTGAAQQHDDTTTRDDSAAGQQQQRQQQQEEDGVLLPVVSSWEAGDLARPGALGDVPGSAHCPVAPLSLEPCIRDDLPHEGGRIIVVGDTHGCFAELLLLLEQQQVDPDTDTVIIIGDLVNKGPQSVELLRYVMASPHVLAIRGNHEDGALTSMAHKAAGREVKPEWNWVEKLSDDEIQYLRSIPLTMQLPKLDLILVHAGLIPGVALAEQPHVVQTKLRVFVRDGATGHPDAWVCDCWALKCQPSPTCAS
jgi:hypothetical protein